MYNELQLMKLLTSSKYKEYIKVISPWDMAPKPLTGYYQNPNQDHAVYFHSNDRLGLGLSMHYSALRVMDYLGQYRPIVEQYVSPDSLEDDTKFKAAYILNFDLDSYKNCFAIPNQDLIAMPVLARDTRPGDFYIEDENGPMNPIIRVEQGDPIKFDIINPYSCRADDLVDTVTGIGGFDMVYTLIPIHHYV